MANAAALPTEIRLMIYKALFDDAFEQYYPHPLLELSDQISNECAPYLFRHLQLNVSNPPQLAHRDEQWVVTLHSRLRECSSFDTVILWEEFLQQRSLSNWFPYLQQVNVQYLGYQGPKPFLASLRIYFDDENSFASTTNIGFSDNMHRALRTLYRRTIKTVIRDLEICSTQLLVKLINILPFREFRSAARRRRGIARACRAEMWERCKQQIALTEQVTGRARRKRRVRQ